MHRPIVFFKNVLPIAIVVLLMVPFFRTQPTEQASAATITPITVVLTAIECNLESDLPNWAGTGVVISASTADTFLMSRGNACRRVPGWQFQWGFGHKKDESKTGVKEAAPDFVGPVPTGDGYNEWKNMGATDATGNAVLVLNDLQGARDLRFREVLPAEYIPFAGNTNAPSVSAEMWCDDDLVYYDNYDIAYRVQPGQTYYCAAFNVKKVQTPADFSVTCEANPSPSITGQTVGWVSRVIGTVTGTHTYSWSGTDGLSGTAALVSNIYTTSGTKDASVSVTINNQTRTAQCSTQVNGPIDPTPTSTPALVASCNATPTTGIAPLPVTFHSVVSGGTGSYSYVWSGSDGLSGTSSTITKLFTATGTKNATLTVVSGAQTKTAQCQSVVTATTSPATTTPPTSTSTPPFSVSCGVSTNNAVPPATITFSATTASGTSPFAYSWSGTDGLSGSSSSISKLYDTNGVKQAFIEVIDAQNKRASSTCQMTMSTPSSNGGGGGGGGGGFTSVTVATPISTSTATTTPAIVVQQLPQAPGVYLAQVPYTGLKENVIGSLMVIMIIGSGAYAFIAYRSKRHVLVYQTAQVASHQNAVRMIKQHNDQIGDVIESYARSHNASLSADAVSALIAAAKGDIAWAQSVISHVITAKHVTRTDEWTLISLAEIKKIYPHM